MQLKWRDRPVADEGDAFDKDLLPFSNADSQVDFIGADIGVDGLSLGKVVAFFLIELLDFVEAIADLVAVEDRISFQRELTLDLVTFDRLCAHDGDLADEWLFDHDKGHSQAAFEFFHIDLDILEEAQAVDAEDILANTRHGEFIANFTADVELDGRGLDLLITFDLDGSDAGGRGLPSMACLGGQERHGEENEPA